MQMFGKTSETELRQFEKHCSALRSRGFQLPDQGRLSVQFFDADRSPDPAGAKAKLRESLMKFPKRPSEKEAAAEKLAGEFADATGHDFDAGQVAVGDVFGRGLRGR